MLAPIFTKTHYTFEGKRPDENVLIFNHSHWFVLFSKLIVFFIFSLLPFVIFYFSREYLLQFGLVGLYWFLTSIYFAFWWLKLAYTVTLYLLNMWVATDQRVVASEQKAFFNRTVLIMNLERIQDMTTVVKGVMPTILQFGDLEIQSAGAVPKLVFRQIPNPAWAKSVINKILKNHKKVSSDNVDM